MKISKEKKDKIFEQILAYLFLVSPKSLYTSHIAKEIARDEEFIKTLMIDLEKKKLVIRIQKNSKGFTYIRRIRWRLSNETYNYYKKKQNYN